MVRQASHVAAVLSGLLASSLAGAAEGKGPSKLEFLVTYRTKVPAPPEGTKRLEIWIPTPFEDGLQEVRALRVESSVPYEVTREPVYGNRMLHAVVEEPRGEVKIDWIATVVRTEDWGQGGGALLKRYCESDRLGPLEGRARRLARELGVVNPKAAVEDRARTIFDHVVETMVYDKETPGWGTGDFERACTVGRGNCSDFAAKFIGIARAADIPTRWVSSVGLSPEHAGCSACGYHCYAQFLTGDRWVPVDASEAQKAAAKDARKASWFFGHADVTNVVLSLGRDLVLEPAQQGDPVNFLGGPYVETDGRPFDVPGDNRTFEYEVR